jgi:hypothetical protein
MYVGKVKSFQSSLQQMRNSVQVAVGTQTGAGVTATLG